jgi:hypothetical protein
VTGALQATRRSLQQVEVVHFESRTSEAIAARLARSLGVHGVGARCATFEAAAQDRRGSVDHRIIVFPIRGDERIPEAVERWILALAPGITHSLWVTGDFRSGQPYDKVAADEATRMLSDRGSPPRSAPILVDTPIADEDLDPLVMRWVEELMDPITVVPAAVQNANGHSGPPSKGAEIEDPALRKLLSLLPAPPRYALDAQGRCTMISFDDGGAYERSLFAGLPDAQVRSALGLLEEMSGLEHVGLPYASLSELGVVLPPAVRKLDLRGNRFVDHAFIQGRGSLAFLNLADCDLIAVPEALATLSNLHTLVIGKNRLVEIPEWFSGIRSLQRLTLYRNQVQAVPGLSRLPALTLLNMGASPLRLGDDALGELPELTVLGLRLLGLARIPRFVEELPRLTIVDISKNPVASGTWPAHPRIRFADRMPDWAWDRT